MVALNFCRFQNAAVSALPGWGGNLQPELVQRDRLLPCLLLLHQSVSAAYSVLKLFIAQSHFKNQMYLVHMLPRVKVSLLQGSNAEHEGCQWEQLDDVTLSAWLCGLKTNDE